MAHLELVIKMYLRRQYIPYQPKGPWRYVESFHWIRYNLSFTQNTFFCPPIKGTPCDLLEVCEPSHLHFPTVSTNIDSSVKVPSPRPSLAGLFAGITYQSSAYTIHSSSSSPHFGVWRILAPINTYYIVK